MSRGNLPGDVFSDFDSFEERLEKIERALALPTAGGGGGVPTGPAGGDLAGTYPNPTIGAGVIVNADVAAAAAIAESKLALASDAAVGTASRRTLGSGALQAMPGNRTLDAIPAPVADVSLANHKLTNGTDPTAAQDFATKNYVDKTGVASVNIEGWHQIGATGEPAFQNGWTNFDSVNQPTAAFKKYPDGRVRLQGIIKSGTVGSVPAFVLPPGYRPSGGTGWRFPITSNALFGNVEVQSNGNVEVTVGSNTWADLSGIEFDTGQALWPSGGSLGPGAIGARVYGSAAISIPNNVATALAFNSERYDTDTIHDPTTNPSRLTCKTAGVYVISAHIAWASAAGTFRYISLRVNGTVIAEQINGVTGNGQQSVAASYMLNPGDYVEVWAQQDSGAALTVIAAGNSTPEFEMVRIPGAQGAALGVTSVLPTSPVDGQECYFLADATNGIVWHLKYRAASASIYKWEYLGGAALFARVDGGQAITSLTYVATGGPSLNVPLAGDYLIAYGARIYNNTVGGPNIMSVSVGATAAVDTDAVDNYGTAVNGGATNAANGASTVKKTGVAANAAIAAAYRTFGGSMSVEKRWINVTPIRVG